MADADNAAAGTGQGETGRQRALRLAAVAVLLGTFAAVNVLIFQKEGGHSLRAGGELVWKPLGATVTWEGIGIVVAAGLTLALYSFLYADNAFFKAAEHLYVGVGLGYSLVLAWFQYIKAELYVPLVKYWVRESWLGEQVPGRPDWKLIVPMILGLFLLARFVRRLEWMSRWAFAFIIGLGAGMSIPLFIDAQVLRQVEQTIAAVRFDALLVALNTLVLLVGVISVLIYFYFSIEHRGAVGLVSKIGIWFLMISFGASFGYTVMGRMALLVGRVQWLIQDWLRIPIQG
ncbi:MAG: hypothetical protein KatS3mg102_2798 [Planctomycetota bacterium]|nr:MAG: hypothetical protein KatS3mg102_2798 [Planctomycetota bacterium]